MKEKYKIFIAIVLFNLFVISIFAQSADKSDFQPQTQGELLFKQNKTQDAVEVLEYEILNGQISENTYNILGLAYYQLGDYEKSVDAFNRGLRYGKADAKIINYNLGNTYYAMKDYISASECFSQALAEDDKFYDAILNRANALLMSDQLKMAHEQYSEYIKKNPGTEQKDSIEQMILALEEEITRREEEARLLAERNKSVWEEYDASITENQNDSKKIKWEKVENEFQSRQTVEDSSQWERILPEGDNVNHTDFANSTGEEKWEKIGTADTGKRAAMTNKIDWEHIDSKSDEDIIELENKQMVEDMMETEIKHQEELLDDMINPLQNPDNVNKSSESEKLEQSDLLP